MGPAAFLQVGSTVLGAAAQIQQGQQAYRNDYATANELNDQGNADLASSTRQAYGYRQQGNQIMGNAAAAMAANGGVTDDAGAIENFGAMDARTKFNAMAALFQGKTAKAGADRQARIYRQSGNAALRNSRLAAFSTLLGGGSKAYDYMK